MRIDSSQFIFHWNYSFHYSILFFLLFDIEGIHQMQHTKEEWIFNLFVKIYSRGSRCFTIITNISSIHNNLFTNEHLLEEYIMMQIIYRKATDFNAEKLFGIKLYRMNITH